MKIIIEVVFDSGMIASHEIQQIESGSKEEIKQYIEETTETIYSLFQEDGVGSYKMTDVNDKVIVINLSKVSSFNMFIG